MADYTPNLGLKYIVYRQQRSDLTVNENYDRIDAALHELEVYQSITVLIDVSAMQPTIDKIGVIGYRYFPEGGTEIVVCLPDKDDNFSWVQILQNV